MTQRRTIEIQRTSAMTKAKILDVVAAVLVAGAACFVYMRALDAPFVFDDSASVKDNRSITALWPLIGDAEHPGPLNPPVEKTTSGRPLVNLSLAMNYHFGQFNPAGYHLFNLIVHVLSAWLLMGIVRRTLCLDYFAGRFDRASEGLSLVVALLWAVHPLQTETVVYVTQRTELMVGFFYLATVYASLRYWAASSIPGRRIWLAVACLACLAGAASKEVMVTAPVAVLLFERTFIRGSFGRALRASWPLYVGLFSSWGLLLYLNCSAPRSDTAGFALGVPAYAWWLTQAKVVLLYLKLTIWPWPLLIHYEMPYLTTLSAAWMWLVPVMLLAIATLILLWRRNAIGFVGAWTFLILSPTLVVPIVTEVAAERRMYLPSAALIALLVVGGYTLLQKMAHRLAFADVKRASRGRWPAALAVAIALVMAAVLVAVSVDRLGAYRDELTLWQDTVNHQSGDYFAHNNLGNALKDAGRFEDAIQQYEQSLQLRPAYATSHYNLGIALAHLGRMQEAVEQYQQALKLKPDDADTYNNLGNALLSLGRVPEAIEQYQNAKRIKPDYFDAYNGLGAALLASGRPREAAEQYQQALRLKPDDATINNNLAAAYAEQKRPAEAIAAAERGLELRAPRGKWRWQRSWKRG